jgi:hypothetical protein
MCFKNTQKENCWWSPLLLPVPSSRDAWGRQHFVQKPLLHLSLDAVA